MYGTREGKLKSSGKILVIDHDAATREFLVDLLTPKYCVRTASNAIDGLEYLECEHFDLLILSMDLPGLCGEQALARVKSISNCPGLAILAISTDGRVCERLLATGKQVDEVLTKPFTLKELE